MSKAYEMISESLNELIYDLEVNEGKNLKCEVMTAEVIKAPEAAAEGKTYRQQPISRSQRVFRQLTATQN
ncbi:MAG: hypothetical protein IJK81_07530 [Selenomonadaceae bacterium]|nr:hypothetical protein [Selenomonadaceae bacterium]